MTDHLVSVIDACGGDKEERLHSFEVLLYFKVLLYFLRSLSKETIFNLRLAVGLGEGVSGGGGAVGVGGQNTAGAKALS